MLFPSSLCLWCSTTSLLCVYIWNFFIHLAWGSLHFLNLRFGTYHNSTKLPAIIFSYSACFPFYYLLLELWIDAHQTLSILDNSLGSTGLQILSLVASNLLVYLSIVFHISNIVVIISVSFTWVFSQTWLFFTDSYSLPVISIFSFISLRIHTKNTSFQFVL